LLRQDSTKQEDVELVCLAEYIREHFSGKVVEVGVGRRTILLETLRKYGMEVMGVDIKPVTGVMPDDIFSPQHEIYEGAELICAIRPPTELWVPIAKIASKVGAELILRPLGSEHVCLSDFYRKEKAVNLKDVSFLHFRHQ